MEGYIDYHRAPQAQYKTIEQYNEQFGAAIPSNAKYDEYFKAAYDKAKEETEEGELITAELYSIEDEQSWLPVVEPTENDGTPSSGGKAAEEVQEAAGEGGEDPPRDEFDDEEAEGGGALDENDDEGEEDEGEEKEPKSSLPGSEEEGAGDGSAGSEQSGDGISEVDRVNDDVNARANALQLRDMLQASDSVQSMGGEDMMSEVDGADAKSLQSSLSVMIQEAERTESMVDEVYGNFHDGDDRESLLSNSNSLQTVSTTTAGRLRANLNSGTRENPSLANMGATGGDYVDNFKFKVRLEKAYSEIEDLSKLLQHRDRELRRAANTILKKEGVITSLSSEADALRQESQLLEEAARRAERNAKRKDRQLKHYKDQLVQMEEVNRELTRRVAAQRNELKTYNETMKLMEQSRQEAEDMSDAALKQLRAANKRIQMSPGARSQYSYRRADGKTPSRLNDSQFSKRNSLRQSRGTLRTMDKTPSGKMLPRIEGKRGSKSPNFKFDEESFDDFGKWDSARKTPPRRSGIDEQRSNSKPIGSNRRIIDRYSKRDERGATADYKDPDDRPLNTDASRLAAENASAPGISDADKPKDPIQLATEMNEAAVKVQASARGFLTRSSPPKEPTKTKSSKKKKVNEENEFGLPNEEDEEEEEEGEESNNEEEEEEGGEELSEVEEEEKDNEEAENEALSEAEEEEELEVEEADEDDVEEEDGAEEEDDEEEGSKA
jgi:hypothetical protein